MVLMVFRYKTGMELLPGNMRVECFRKTLRQKAENNTFHTLKVFLLIFLVFSNIVGYELGMISTQSGYETGMGITLRKENTAMIFMVS